MELKRVEERECDRGRRIADWMGEKQRKTIDRRNKREEDAIRVEEKLESSR